MKQTFKILETIDGVYDYAPVNGSKLVIVADAVQEPDLFHKLSDRFFCTSTLTKQNNIIMICVKK